MDIRQLLFDNQDSDYKAFHKKLIPTVDEERIIGVRIPTLRKIAKVAVKENMMPQSYYYEEIMVMGLMIGYSKKSIAEYLNSLSDFVKLIDNWAVCDSVASNCKFTLKYMSDVWQFILSLLDKGEYSTRFALVMMMDYYLTDDYIDDVINIYKNIHTDLYYINMAVSWGLSVAFVKYRQMVMPLLQNGSLDDEIHNRTIQKICDSFRVDKDTKTYIKTLRRKTA